MKKLQSFPFHPFLLAFYSILALLAHNISEVRANVAVRPMVLLIVGCAVVLLLLRALLKNWHRAGVLTAILVLLFITYGHLYNSLETNPAVGLILGRHRVLLPVYLLILAAGVLWAWRRKTPPVEATRLLNLFALLLLLFPLVQLTSAGVTASRGEREASQWTFSQPLLQPVNPEALPDVYYIVLDTYTSTQALKEDFSFDNSPIEERLKAMGFYIAESSQTNYTYTQGAITAALNLDYLPVLGQRLKTVDLENHPWVLLKDSLVRHQLERIGYRTVAFETSYEWSRISDADIFLGAERASAAWQQLDPFERMWANSTALMLLKEIEVGLRSGSTANEADHPWSDHIQKQRFVLETLPEIAGNPDPTFTFAHILIPHVPYVFAADGSILTDPGYFGTEQAGPVDEDYLQKGYTGEIAFINSQMENILSEILARSATPPIIVVMGDHGLRDANRPKIFYAVYLPDGAKQVMYPTITPVNTFRVIFDTYFGTSYGLLPDITEAE